MANEEDDVKEYRWESGYEKTWEAIREDDEGNLEASVAEIIQRAKRKAQLEKKGHSKLGMMRHLYVVLDASEAMLDQDLKPTRQLCTLKLLEEFIGEYLYESPLSQLGFIMTRNKRAERVSELSGNGKKQLEALKSQYNVATSCSGEPSLQNGLELALSTLKNMPSHASREILVILGSLTTCDPGDINITIQSLKSNSVRVSVVGVGSAEVYVCSELAKATGGSYSVALDDSHFRHLLNRLVQPPPATTDSSTSTPALVKMGFPHHGTSDSSKSSTLAMCMCHVDEGDGKLIGGGYSCPQCRSKYCELPVECRICGLMLVSAPHLARSYHHLFPVEPFTELLVEQSGSASCYTCLRTFKLPYDKHVYRCETCWRFFCLRCDMFVHDTLHLCPGCATNRDTYQKKIED